MDNRLESVITIGQHVIVKKQNYTKVYKVSASGNIMLGTDQVNMSEIVGKPFWTTFEMVPSRTGKRTFALKATPKAESWNDLIAALPSGTDNRSITDDGNSQKLSKEEILRLQHSGKSGKEIVGSLIENNKSFVEKTEYSQEKYIKKKERKYLKYLTICKPSIELLHDIYFRYRHNRIGGLRMDALSQILSYSDVQSEGSYILYDSGSQGLPAAAMLNRIGAKTQGILINLHPGNLPQMSIVQAMDFPKEQMDRMIMVNIYSFLRFYYQGESSNLSNASQKMTSAPPSEIVSNNRQDKDTDGLENQESNGNKEADEIDNVDEPHTDDTERSTEIINNTGNLNLLKRRSDEPIETTCAKKPKWYLETQRAVNLISSTKIRGLVVIAKEHPLNIVEALLPFLGLSRPFVIFHTHREPLQETYVTLKQRQGIINLRLFSSFLRSYQVLSDRTHPDIITSDTGGYILTGYFVRC